MLCALSSRAKRLGLSCPRPRPRMDYYYLRSAVILLSKWGEPDYYYILPPSLFPTFTFTFIPTPYCCRSSRPTTVVYLCSTQSQFSVSIVRYLLLNEIQSTWRPFYDNLGPCAHSYKKPLPLLSARCLRPPAMPRQEVGLCPTCKSLLVDALSWAKL